nr:protein AATF-like [Lytechinus pictus]
MKHKQVTLSEQILALNNPTPVDDPSDYWDENTTAKVAEFDEGDEEDTIKKPSVLRRKTAHQSIEEDGRYTGLKTSRQQWSSTGQGDNEIISEEDDELDGDEEDDDVEDAEEDDDDQEDDDDDDAEEDDDDQEVDNDEEDDELMTQQIREMTRKLKGKRENVSMDVDEESSDDFDDADDNDDDDEDDDDEEDYDDEDEEEEDGGIEGFSQINTSEEIEKGKAVQSQLGLWDGFMESRIKLQKALHLSNQLPQCQTLDRFLEDGEEDGDLPIILKKSEKELTRLMQSLVSLQDTLLQQNPETQHIIHGETPGNQSMNANEGDDDDEEIPSDDDEPKTVSPAVERKSLKRKLDPSDFEEHLAKHHKNFESYRNSTIQKWYEKTRLSTGKLNKKSFSGFERSALVQIQQILQDQNRLVQRTQLKRSEYTVLGQRSQILKREEESEDGEKQDEDIPELANQHLKNHDPEIFDDDDFYHQLLRELIERRTSSTTDPIQLTRQWLQVQKLRTKVKRQVDTKASKGRKVRYDVHQKLVSFMAPVDTSTMLQEARMELFKSIFGQSLTEEETAR